MKVVLNVFSLLGRRDRATYLLLLLGRVSTHSLDILGLASLVIFVGSLSGSKTPFGGTLNSLPGLDVLTGLTPLALGGFVASVFVSKSLVAATLLSLTTRFLSRVEREKASLLVDRFFNLSGSELQRLGRGRLSWTLVESTQFAFPTMLFSLATLTVEVALFFMISAVFFFVDPLAALGASGFFLMVMAAFQLVINRRLKILAERLEVAEVKLHNLVRVASDSLSDLAPLGSMGPVISRLKNARAHRSREWAAQRFLLASPRFVIEAALMLGVAALLGWQFWLTPTEPNLESVAVFLVGGLRMVGAVLPIQHAFSELRIAIPQARAALNALTRAAISAPKTQFHRRKDMASLGVEFRNVSFRYPTNDIDTLRDVNFSLAPGAKVGFFGPSGSGKSTLAGLTAGIESPTRGEILVGGQSPFHARGSLGNGVAYVPQRPSLIPGSVAENIALCTEDTIDWDKLEEVMETVGLDSDPYMPTPTQGLGPATGRSQSGLLSGGQMQRVALARALYARPGLVILDEADSALDADSKKIARVARTSFPPSTTLVVISHQIRGLAGLDRFFSVENGFVVES